MNTKKYEELLVLLRSHKTDKEILEVLSDYHENDIADMLAGMPETQELSERTCAWQISAIPAKHNNIMMITCLKIKLLSLTIQLSYQ